MEIHRIHRSCLNRGSCCCYNIGALRIRSLYVHACYLIRATLPKPLQILLVFVVVDDDI